MIIDTHTVPAPDIITDPTDTSAAAPFSAVFTCSARGCGKLNIIWHRRNKPLPQRAYSTTSASVNGTTSTLTIPNVVSDDVGTYYCVVRAGNKATESKIVRLLLAGKVRKSSYAANEFKVLLALLQHVILFRSAITTSSSSCS